MNKNLLDRVSIEKIEALIDALNEVISSMRIKGEDSATCFCNEAYLFKIILCIAEHFNNFFAT